MRSLNHAAHAGLATILALVFIPLPSAASDGAAGPGACESRDVVSRVEPPDARGTTFVGTYVGDIVSGYADGQGGDPLPLIAAWDVERVYAGGPLPRDLLFRTPACGWTNLTPGVRYLFSTGASDVDWSSPDAGQPSASDSLAWELLPDGAVRIAPFDTYAASDYTSEELLAITSFEDALWSVAPTAGEGIPPGPAHEPDFGCLEPWFTGPPEDAQGTTFVGRYIGEQELPGPAAHDVRTFWALERVYAGGPMPEIMTMRSPGCAAIRLEAGHRYLFSTADPSVPSTRNSLAWVLPDDGDLRLAPFGTLSMSDYPPAVRSLTTLTDVLATVAPGTGVGQPPERAGDRTPG
jgi:hypothetical protein